MTNPQKAELNKLTSKIKNDVEGTLTTAQIITGRQSAGGRIGKAIQRQAQRRQSNEFRFFLNQLEQLFGIKINRVRGGLTEINNQRRKRR